MINPFDIFNQQEKPHVSLCNPDYSELYSLSALYNTNITLRWNGQSEFSFTYPKTVNGIDLDSYDYIEGKRIIKIENIGYFMIYQSPEDYDGIIQVKNVKCLSHDFELVFKKLNLLSGTYRFYNSSDPSDETTLLGVIMPMIPNWSINSVDSSLSNLYRTFDISDSNVYQFFTKDVSIAYGCIFKFNYLERSIDIVPITRTPTETDIFLSFDNLLKHTEYDEITEEITTCLYCYGGDDLTIRGVNPLGTNSIYNFTYYKNTDWMSQSLIDAISAWESKLETYTDNYDLLLIDLSNEQASLLDYEATLAEFESQLLALQEIRIVRVAAELDTTDIDNQISLMEAFIADQEALILMTNDSINDIINQMSTINENLSFTNTDNFTNSQYLELNNFIFENTYKNDNIIQTDSMTVEEIQEQSQQLYDSAIDLLNRISIPRYEVSINLINFLTLKEYEPLIDQLELGDQITIDSGKGYIIDATLLAIEFSYDDPSNFSVVLGNRERIEDRFTDFLGQTASASFDISYGILPSTSASSTSTGTTTIISSGSLYILEDLSGQTGSGFTSSRTYVPESLRIFVNGIFQRRDFTFSEGSDYRSFVMLDPILPGDYLSIEYMPS